jgi:hypothetical protein
MAEKFPEAWLAELESKKIPTGVLTKFARKPHECRRKSCGSQFPWHPL